MATMSTPVNTISRENLSVLIRNNIMNSSCEFSPDQDVMETDSPIRKPKTLQPIIKRLFHSPMLENSKEMAQFEKRSSVERSRRETRKRKKLLLPDSAEKIKRAYVKECDEDGYSPELCAGMRKKILTSLFHNKEYSMDCDCV